MQITLYHRTFPVKGAPVALSLVPFPEAQKHTYTLDGKIYDAVRKELRVIVPDDAKIDVLKNLLCWHSDKGLVKSTATEVYEFAQAQASGFKTVK
jgi:hypothetical protein